MIEFKQGVDPFKAMKIGSHRDPAIGDKYKALYTLDWLPGDSSHWSKAINPHHSDLSLIHENKILIIDSINNKYPFHNTQGVQTIDHKFISYEDLDKFFERL
jgi:hypothetical protein